MLGIVVAVLVLAAIGSSRPPGASGPIPSPTPLTSISPPIGTTPLPTQAVVTSPPATPAPTIAAPFEPIVLKGSGNKVAKFTIPADAAAIATASYSGSDNFAVWSIAADGSENDLLVNVIGKYNGTVLFDASSGEHSVAMRVETSGSWTITIKPLNSAQLWHEGATANGKGDAVLLVESPPSGLVTSQITHTGDSNFAVLSYTADGDRDLLVNEIGNYSGEVQIPSGTVLVAVTSEGTWSITFPS